MRTMIAQKIVLGAGVALMAAGMLQAQEPGTQESGWRQVTACAPDKGGFTCSRAGFHHVWRRAKSVQVETNAMDKGAKAQVEEYLASVGKTVTADSASAELLFVLKPVDSTGVHVGPAGSDLSVLSVYLITDGKRGALVWSETFNGQPDMRWPTVVHASLEQFRGEFDKKRR